MTAESGPGPAPAGPVSTTPRGGSPLAANVVIGDRYTLERPIGAGAAGVVWSARHLTLGHAVAIKFLAGTVAVSREARRRFEREARLCARLAQDSVHIARVMDHGVHAAGTPYLVMERLEGESLEDRVSATGRLSLTEAADIVVQLCRALHVAHAAGVVHRDLKPANVFLCRSADGTPTLVKLLDFGVAKAREPDEPALTREGTVVGTPAYMSPEQIEGDRAVDGRTDLWAAAVVLYRAVTGALPFGDGTVAEMARRVFAGPPMPPSHHAPGLPPALDQVLARALSLERNDRYPSARALAAAVAQAAALPDPGSFPMRWSLGRGAVAAGLALAASGVSIAVATLRPARFCDSAPAGAFCADFEGPRPQEGLDLDVRGPATATFEPDEGSSRVFRARALPSALASAIVVRAERVPADLSELRISFALRIERTGLDGGGGLIIARVFLADDWHLEVLVKPGGRLALFPVVWRSARDRAYPGPHLEGRAPAPGAWTRLTLEARRNAGARTLVLQARIGDDQPLAGVVSAVPTARRVRLELGAANYGTKSESVVDIDDVQLIAR